MIANSHYHLQFVLDDAISGYLTVEDIVKKLFFGFLESDKLNNPESLNHEVNCRFINQMESAIEGSPQHFLDIIEDDSEENQQDMLKSFMVNCRINVWVAVFQQYLDDFIHAIISLEEFEDHMRILSERHVAFSELITSDFWDWDNWCMQMEMLKSYIINKNLVIFGDEVVIPDSLLIWLENKKGF
jgi:hypothetical protein